MLYLLQQYLVGEISFLRIFKYQSVRAILAFFMAFLLVLIVGRPFINFLKRKKGFIANAQQIPSSGY